MQPRLVMDGRAVFLTQQPTMFWVRQRVGENVDEWEISDARNVREVLEWADELEGAIEVFVALPDGDGFITPQSRHVLIQGDYFDPPGVELTVEFTKDEQ